MSDEEKNRLLEPPPPNKENWTESFRTLAEFTKTDLPNMPENIFVQHILPMLTSEPGKPVDLTRWLDVAGTPMRSIAVVDSITGEFLFMVPPLMRSLPTVAQAEVNYSNIVTEALAHEEIHPVQAERYLDRELSKARTGATLLDVDTAKQWNLIRQRYKLPLIPIPGEANPLAAAPTAGPLAGVLNLSDEQEDF